MLRDWDRILRLELEIKRSHERIQILTQPHRKLLQWLEEQPLRDRESLTKLARRGWFLGPRMPVAVIPQLGRTVEVSPNDVDEAVGLHVRRHLDDIEAALVESYPHRSQLVQEGFWAHRKCKYSLSIPAFLIQADGIFHDSFQKYLFITRERKDAVRAVSSEVRGRFFQAVLYPLSVDTPLWVDTRCLEDTFEGLNRHQVLHGIEVEYNTELNSLKAISLLDNLLWVLNEPADGC